MFETKESLKEKHNAPDKGSYDTLEEYMAAKDEWILNNQEIYQQILASPSRPSVEGGR